MEGIISILCGVFPLAISILLIRSWWIIYDKMGEKGWKCLIPFYGRYLLFHMVWEGKIYFISLALEVIASFFSAYIAADLLAGVFAGSIGVIGGITVSTGLFLFAAIFSAISFAMRMMLNWRMVKCFGHGIGYFLGITFLPIFFLPILAYGRSYYDYY